MVIFSRFLAGLFVNSQFLIRKKLQSLSLTENVDCENMFRKAQTAQRCGIMCGGLLSVFFFKTQVIMVPFFQDKALATFGGLLVLLQFSGLLLVLLIETPIVQLSEFKNRYAELPEIKSVRDGIDTDRQSKENTDTSNLFNISMLPIESSYSEENQGIDEVKYYSPRCVVNKVTVPKQIQSARSHISPMFEFPDSKRENKEVEEDDHKKIHISFIDEEFEMEENSDEVEKPDTVPAPDKPIYKNTTVNVLNRDAHYFRGLLLIAHGTIFECVAVSIYLQCIHRGAFIVTGISAMCLFVSLAMHQLLSKKLMQNVSVYNQILIFSAIPGAIFLFFPLIDYLTNDPLVFIPFWILLLYSGEVLLPAGSILIADSVPSSLRENELSNRLTYSICIKSVPAYFACSLLTLTNQNFSISILSLPFLIILSFRHKLKSFIYLSDVPYQV